MRSKDHEKKQQTTSPIPVGLYRLRWLKMYSSYLHRTR